jgi:TatD DNase family protein
VLRNKLPPATTDGPLMSLFDIGANLTNKAFRDDLTDVLAHAHAAGVQHVVITGTSVLGSKDAARLAETSASPVKLYATAGVHPHHAKDFGPLAVHSLRDLTKNRSVVAVGECGLDFDRNFSSRADQLSCFEAQLQLACEVKLPVFLHERAAHEDFYKIVTMYRPKLCDAVVHCFTGDAKALSRYLDLDLHIGLTGWLTDPRRGQHLVELARRIPASRLMIETDAPYILPKNVGAPRRDRRNEPAYLRGVLSAVAAARNESIQETARTTTDTALRFFRLSP